MLNTCSIGRRWKSREGWSRPVLTGERGTLFPIPLGDWVSSCGGFLVGWQGTLFLVVTTIGKAFDLLASVVRFPDRHDRNRSCGWFRCRPIPVGVGRLEWFCGGHGPGETPGPFPNPEAKAWHGDGTALERVWESSAPPHSTVWTFWSSPPGGFPEGPFFIFPLGVPGALRPAGTPIFYAFFRCSLPVACGRLPFHNTPRITWSASVTVINDVMRLTRYVRAGSRESRYDGKRHKPDD